jgi:hypothetical protein
LLPQLARRGFVATILVGMNPRSSTPAASLRLQAAADGAACAVLSRLASSPRFVTIERSAHCQLVPASDGVDHDHHRAGRSVFFRSIRSKEVRR